MANRKKTEAERRAEFLARRRTGIGGSDVGAIMGVDQYRDAIDVYIDKVNPGEDFDNPQMERGRRLEPIVADIYVEMKKRPVRPGKFRRDRIHKFLIGSPDRIIKANGAKPHATPSDGPGVLEVKTANRFVMKKMEVEGLPKSYILQIQHYMGLCGVSWGAFAVLCPDPWEFRSFTVEFDRDLYEKVLEVLRRFWIDNVLAKVPPKQEVIDFGDEVEKGTDVVLFEQSGAVAQWQKNVDLFREASAMLKLGNAAKDHAKDKLKELMDQGPGIYEGHGARFHLTNTKGRRSFMEKELRAMQPIDPIKMGSLLTEAGMELDDIELFFEAARMDLDAYVKTGKPFDTLRMYDSKELL
jgi:putative phage-type endonuclease